MTREARVFCVPGDVLCCCCRVRSHPTISMGLSMRRAAWLEEAGEGTCPGEGTGVARASVLIGLIASGSMQVGANWTPLALPHATRRTTMSLRSPGGGGRPAGGGFRRLHRGDQLSRSKSESSCECSQLAATPHTCVVGSGKPSSTLVRPEAGYWSHDELPGCLTKLRSGVVGPGP